MKTYSRKNSSYMKKAFIGCNFNEMCRLCLSELDTVLTPIFQDSKISYQERIQFSVDVMVEEDDGLPTNICEKCLWLVEQSYLFKKKCKASDAKLREHLELLEINKEIKLNGTFFEDVSENMKTLFSRDEDNNRSDESSAIDSGGTDIVPTLPEGNNKTSIPNEPIVTEGYSKTSMANITEPEMSVQETLAKIQLELESTDSESEENVVFNKVQRYILKGKKSGEDQEEDLTVCEIVPLYIGNEDLDSQKNIVNMEIDDLESPLGYFDPNEYTNAEIAAKSVTKIQEICELWNNEEEEEQQIEVIIEDAEIGKKECEGKAVVLEWNFEGNMNENETKHIEELINANEGERNGNKNNNSNEIFENVSNSSQYKCFTCSESFSSMSELKVHLAIVHREISGAAYCQLCSKIFTCANSLKRHMTIHTGLKAYKCKICERKFSQGSILKRHVLTHENQKPYNCDICKKSYTQKMNLLRHLKVHGLVSEPKSFPCKYCPKSFIHQSGLSRHLKSHKNFRFLCIYCEKAFSDSSSLGKHHKTEHKI